MCCVLPLFSALLTSLPFLLSSQLLCFSPGSFSYTSIDPSSSGVKGSADCSRSSPSLLRFRLYSAFSGVRSSLLVLVCLRVFLLVCRCLRRFACSFLGTCARMWLIAFLNISLFIGVFPLFLCLIACVCVFSFVCLS